MGELRDRMTRELQLRRYAPATQKTYLEAVVGLTKHFGVAPDQLSASQVQDYLLHLIQQRRNFGVAAVVEKSNRTRVESNNDYTALFGDYNKTRHAPLAAVDGL